MKVLFLVPGFAEVYGKYRHLYRKGFLNPPMSLCYLAGALKDAGQDAQIIDGEAEHLSNNEILSRVRVAAPGLIGLTATSVNFDSVHDLAALIKRDFPEIPIVIGGTHLNIFGSEILRLSSVFDFGCIGDGEDLITELTEALESGQSVRLGNIAGLLWRDGDSVHENPNRPIETNIDRYHFPARELLRNELYIRSIPRAGYVQTAAFMSSRGCPYSCIYCAVKNIHGGTTVRLRSAKNVLDELQMIVTQFHIHHLSFNDDCLTINRDRMLDICDGILSRGLKITWEGLSRADLVDRELLRSMRRAGFVRISFGIESGNPEILKVLNKKESLEQIEKAIRIAKEAGIVTRGSVIIGSPYETKGTIRDTFRFVNRLKELDQVVINILQPYPGTKVRDMVLKGEGGSRLIEDTEASSKNLQRFGKASISVNDVTPNDLVLLQKYGFCRFYFRPRVILNNARISGWRAFVQDSCGFVRSILGV